jgi:uncharacterized repeat protein (TIGR03803 family)
MTKRMAGKLQSNRATHRTLHVAVTSLLLLLTSLLATAQTETVLYSFSGGKDGGAPSGGLLRDGKGNLYGTTAEGGNTSLCGEGCGVVFELLATGNLKVLYTFLGEPDGRSPRDRLVMDNEGNLYGTTVAGGSPAPGCDYGSGCGAIFKLNSSGTEKILYRFKGESDGGSPLAGVIRDAAGNLYGTTTCGGSRLCAGGGYGTVFELKAGGAYTVLHTFTGGADGAIPNTLVEDGSGNLYGTTIEGGISNSNGGSGVVFEISAAGEFKVLYSFTGTTDGGSPRSGLTLDAQGNIYGATFAGGSSGGSGFGVVFELTQTGQETVLHRFNEGEGNPEGKLIMDAKGNLYGTTLFGGYGGGNCVGFTFGCGTVFELTPAGVEKILYDFTGGADGGFPDSGVIGDGAGNFYGTTPVGGTDGVVFKVRP